MTLQVPVAPNIVESGVVALHQGVRQEMAEVAWLESMALHVPDAPKICQSGLVASHQGANQEMAEVAWSEDMSLLLKSAEAWYFSARMAHHVPLRTLVSGPRIHDECLAPAVVAPYRGVYETPELEDLSLVLKRAEAFWWRSFEVGQEVLSLAL